MIYPKVVPGIFLSRPNRFIAHVLVDGREEIAHVKNTGRCRELLVPGCRVWLACADKAQRKTAYDLIVVEKGERIINMDSQAPNQVVEELLKKIFPDAQIRREVVYGGSRFDFRISRGEETTFLEVKGVTLEEDGIAMFPDAPTERGVKHIRELMTCAGEGYGAALLFVVKMKGISLLRPNDCTHPAFGEALREAARRGVKIHAVDCLVTENSLQIDRELPIDLSTWEKRNA